MQFDFRGSVRSSLIKYRTFPLGLVQPDDDPAIAAGAQVYGGRVGFEVAAVAYDVDSDHGLGALSTGHDRTMETWKKGWRVVRPAGEG